MSLSVNVVTPLMYAVPVIFAPVEVTTSSGVAPPLAFKLIFPFAGLILIELLPLAKLPIILPVVILPDTVSDVNVPKLVTFGCAAVVSVPVSKEPRTVPLLA